MFPSHRSILSCLFLPNPCPSTRTRTVPLAFRWFSPVLNFMQNHIVSCWFSIASITNYQFYSYSFTRVCLVLYNFITCEGPCFHHHSQNTEQTSHQDLSCGRVIATPASSCPLPPYLATKTTHLFSISKIVSFKNVYIDGIIQCVMF